MSLSWTAGGRAENEFPIHSRAYRAAGRKSMPYSSESFKWGFLKHGDSVFGVGKKVAHPEVFQKLT